MNRRSFLHRLTATAGAVCAGFALELLPRDPEPELDFEAIWRGSPWAPDGANWAPAQWTSKAVSFMKEDGDPLAMT